MAQDANAKSAPTLGSLCLIDRLKRARNFPHNTCAASRHAEMIGKEMLRKEGETTEGESILAAVAALYEARTALAERQWISVAERLPGDGEDVLAWAGSYLFVAWREGHGMASHWSSTDEAAMLDRVTHWMPLPSCPGPS